MSEDVLCDVYWYGLWVCESITSKLPQMPVSINAMDRARALELRLTDALAVLLCVPQGMILRCVCGIGSGARSSAGSGYHLWF